jgi:hypothetical protein
MLYLRPNRVIFPRFVALDTVFELGTHQRLYRKNDAACFMFLTAESWTLVECWPHLQMGYPHADYIFPNLPAAHIDDVHSGGYAASAHERNSSAYSAAARHYRTPCGAS